MKFNSLIKLPLFISLIVAGSLSVAAQPPEITVEGLHRVKDTNLAMVYAQPGISLGQYRRIYLADTYVAFKKDWQRRQNRAMTQRISSDDMAKIKVELSSLFREVFSETLQQGGYELATERAEDVLIIKPAIINLDVIAPDTMSASNSYTYAESAGEMTLYLELYDSLTDDLIAKALDRKMDRETGYIRWQNRVTNRAAAKRILQVWAEVLTEGLDEASRTGTE